MTPATVAECAADILRALVDADVDRLERCIDAVESARDEARVERPADAAPLDLLADAAATLRVLLERIEQQQRQNHRDLEQSFQLLTQLTGLRAAPDQQCRWIQ